MANLLTFILVHVCWKVFHGFSILFTSCCIIKSNLCLFHINHLSAYFWQRSRDQDYSFRPLQPHRLQDCSLNSVQLFNHFINSSQMPWQAQYNVKTMGGEKVEDCPSQLTLIFIFWYLSVFHYKYQCYKYERNTRNWWHECGQIALLCLLYLSVDK